MEVLRRVGSRLHTNIWCFAVLALLAITPLPEAFAQSNFPPLPGWTHSGSQNRTGNQSGVMLPGREVSYSSPVIAEIDGNTGNGKETAVGTSDGTLHVVRADGSVAWSRPLPNQSCRGNALNNKLHSSPAVGELFGNGIPYVVVGYGGTGGPICDGGIAAFRGTDGEPLFTFSLKKFAKKQRYGSRVFAVWSTPGLADVDGDGKMEIGFGGFDRNVYLLNANGSVRWYYNAADTIWSSATFANIDNDPDLEMIIGTDISGNSRLRPVTKNGGYVYAFKTKPRKPMKINFRDSRAYVWQTAFDQVIYSSPTVADVIPSSPGPEVIVGSGCFFPQGSANKAGRWVKIMNGKTGQVIRTLSASACMSASPAVGDLDGDGNMEVVITANGHGSIGGDGQSRVHAWHAETGDALWTVTPRDRGGNDEYGGNFVSPVIADVDGNGSLEVVVANNSSVQIYNGATGEALTCEQRDCGGQKLQLYAGSHLRSTPAIGDIDGDGLLDIVIGAESGSSGALFSWTGFLGNLNSPNGSHSPFYSPWPMFKGNAARAAR